MSDLGTTLTYRYNVYKVLEQDMALLNTDSNPFANVIMTVLIALQKQKIDEEQLYDLKLDLARRLLSKSFSKEKIRILMNFLRYYVRFDKPESISKFDEQIDILTKQRKTMGIEEFLLYRAEKQGEMKGIEKGIEKSKQDFIKNLLLKTDFTSEKIADLVGLPVTAVERIKKKSK